MDSEKPGSHYSLSTNLIVQSQDTCTIVPELLNRTPVRNIHQLEYDIYSPFVFSLIISS